MKLNHKLLLCLFLGLLFTLPQVHASSDDVQLPILPPVHPNHVSMSKSSSSVEVIFHETADDMLVEVFTEKGQLIYQEKGIANAQTRLLIDAQSWKGTYVIRVSLNDYEKFFNVFF